MPQIKKEDIKSRLYLSAKKEFVKRGFKGASLRTISKSAGISLANIYSYAKDKDDLFRSVLANVVMNFDYLTEHFKNYHQETSDFDSLKLEEDRIKGAVGYIFKNRVELNLLLNLSSGSSLEDYPENIVEGYAANCKRFLKYLPKQNRQLTFKEPSDFFFKSVARLALGAIGEIVKHDFSIREMEKVAHEIVRYNFHGFRGLAEVAYKKQ